MPVLLPAALAMLLSADAASAAADPATLYAKSCRSCHGVDARGDAKTAAKLKVDPGALNLADEPTRMQSDGDLLAMIANGKGRMPGYKRSMSAAGRSALLAYVRRLADAPAAAVPGGAGAALYAGRCASCHGPTGRGNPAMAKALRVTAASLELVSWTTRSRTGELLTKVVTDGAGMMPGFGRKLTTTEIAESVAHVRSLSATPAR